MLATGPVTIRSFTRLKSLQDSRAELVLCTSICHLTVSHIPSHYASYICSRYFNTFKQVDQIWQCCVLVLPASTCRVCTQPRDHHTWSTSRTFQLAPTCRVCIWQVLQAPEIASDEAWVSSCSCLISLLGLTTRVGEAQLLGLTSSRTWQEQLLVASGPPHWVVTYMVIRCNIFLSRMQHLLLCPKPLKGVTVPRTDLSWGSKFLWLTLACIAQALVF